MKSNMEYLRDLIEDNSEAIEFWEAIATEIEEAKDEIVELKGKIEDYVDEIDFLKDEIQELRSDITFENTIDCGIGVINYEEPENLQLQILMEEFKETMETKFRIPA